MSDLINHPDHYKANGMECIDVIEALDLGYAFCVGNAIKYIFRRGTKPNHDTLEDLKKARWYIDRAIQILSK